MKKNKNNSLVIALALSLFISLIGSPPVLAATTPTLGTASTFGILSSTYTNTTAGTTINGDVGYTTPPATAPTVNGVTNIANGIYSQAGTDQGDALTALNAQTCNFTFGSPTDLSLLSQPLTPGVYCITAAASIGTGGITLNGAGSYIFRVAGALTTVANSHVTLAGGASACDIFWTPGSATTLGANSSFSGSIIDPSGITIGSTVTYSGRALAFGGTVTTDADTMTVPACVNPQAPAGSPRGTVNIIKIVINDNGGTKTISDFPLFINGVPVTSGATSVFPAPDVFRVTENSNPQYVGTFSGDCDSTGQLSINRGDNKVCILTNDDIGAPVVVPPVPPLIDVIKIPNPLALPGGPGLVTYTYTLRNIGTVPVTNITMVGDICSPIQLVSGDSNGDSKLDVNETWTYTCATNLTQTTTNTIVATGWANGLSATDIANATVVVGMPLVPPLIHVTKIPSPLTLLAGGGMVNYTVSVTNPGTVALSNIGVADNTCTPINYISGDNNSDSKLDTNETWVFTCAMNLTQTTTNTVVATGNANGLTARDFAIATVGVASAVPGLPNTGVSSSDQKQSPWNIIALMSTLLLFSISLVAILKKRTA